MHDIQGKILIFTDLHCGLAGNKQSRLDICRGVVDRIAGAISENGIRAVFFGGDWFHQRASIDGNTINVALNLIETLAALCPIYMCVGNHDAYFKNTVDVNSVNMFRSMKNVHVVDKPMQLLVNGKLCLLAPWLTDFSVFEKNQFDFMIGHFDISSKYLIQQYIREHKAAEAADAATRTKLGLAESDISVGDFVEVVKPDGLIFAGHIHKRREFVTKNRIFIFVGSPYQQNFGDLGDERGYYVLDEDMKYKFTPIDDVPKHVRIMMSQAREPSFDFSVAKHAIVQRVYDVDVQRPVEVAIQVKIEEQMPYEEVVPEYIVKPPAETIDDDSLFSVNTIRKSKLDYIHGYLDSIDQAVLDEHQLDRAKLFEILKNYYEAVIKEQ